MWDASRCCCLLHDMLTPDACMPVALELQHQQCHTSCTCVIAAACFCVAWHGRRC